MEPSSELQRALKELYEAMSSGKPEPVEAFYSLQDGTTFIGMDEGEIWTDTIEHNIDVRPFFDGSFGPVTWTAGEAFAYVEGSVGWTVDRPTLLFGGKEYPMRMTLVWHREDGAWRVVQSHASVGSTSAE